VRVGFAVRNLALRHGFLLLVRYFSDSHNSTMFHVHPSSGGWTLCPIQTTVQHSRSYITPETKNLCDLRTRLIPRNRNLLSGYFLSVSQEVLRAIRNSKVRCSFQNSPTPFFVYPGHTLPYFLFKIHFNIIFSSIPVTPKWSLFY
jgi:hypothetical protein